MTCRVREQTARVYQYQNNTPLWADVRLTMEEQ